MTQDRVAIVGAGLAACLLTLALSRARRQDRILIGSLAGAAAALCIAVTFLVWNHW
jgi:hypothetical protein